MNPSEQAQAHVGLSAGRQPEQIEATLCRRILDRFYTGCFAVSMTALGLMAVAVMLQVGSRLIGVHIPSIPEITGFCMAVSSFLGLAYTFREGGHVRVTMLLINLGDKRRMMFERFVLSVAVLLAVMFAFYLVNMTIVSYEYGEASSGIIPIPLWIPQSLVSCGAICLAIAIVDVWIDVLRGKPPSYINKEEFPQ